jgi:transcriptional regulator with XRE-family HTH domain
MGKDIRLFGKRLRSERNRLKLSQTQVAIAGGVSKTTQVAYEADTHVPDLTYLTRVEDVGLDKIFLITGITTSAFVEKEFDWILLGEICEALIEWAGENGVQIPPHKFSDLLRLLYREFSETKTIEFESLGRVLRLVA